MAEALAAAPPSGRWRQRRWMPWAVLIPAAALLFSYRDLWPWLVKYPRAAVWPLRFQVTDFMKWLINDLSFGLFTFKEFTRSIAWLLEWPLDFARALLAEGLAIFWGGETVLQLPPLSWLGLLIAFTAVAYRLKGWPLALMVGLSFGYLAAFGQWDSAMVTLSSIAVAVPLGVAGGLLLGILGYRHPGFEKAITPILDLMQTVPVFAYLVPVLFLFGFGPVAAMTATIIYAMPPMVRVTMLALKQVPAEVVEFGRMAGCTGAQMTWKILVPAARPSLMVGVNQVIMLSLNMVIIASMIGAGGLGYDVLASLRRLAIGDGVEAGIAITLLAIALDRMSQAMAQRGPRSRQPSGSIGLGARRLLVGLVLLLAGTTLVTALMPGLDAYTGKALITTSQQWKDLVTWINVNFFDELEAAKTFLLLNVMKPFKLFLLQLPWAAVVAALALAGYQLGGGRLALLVAGLSTFVAVTGNWPKAMVSVYLCGLAVLFACLIGIPIGIWAARNDRVHRVVQVVIDTLQTLPAFVYLIPAVMLFRVGDFSAMLAVVAYALAPAIRYTDHGIRRVPPELIEAAKVSGCTPWQMLRKVQLRLALPEIMLGVNQTIMMALSMLVITALVGTRDLGQEVYIALTKADTGRGLVAGVCVAFIAIIADRLISAWAKQRKKELGLD